MDRENTREEQNGITLNVTYYPVFQNVKKILADLHLLLIPDVAHKAVFTNVPRICFKNDGSLKYQLVRLCYPRVMRKADPNHAESGISVLVRYVNK